MNTLSPNEINDGWQLLFDGTTLQGWHRFNKTGTGPGWQVVENSLHFDGRARDEESKSVCNDLVTDRSFGDFHLKAEWKISVNGNSGIMFHVQEGPAYHTPWVTGPEMQLLDNDGHRDGAFIKHRAGDLYDLVACSRETVKPVGEWNQAEIIVHQERLVFRQNGEEVVSIALWDDKWRELVDASKFNSMPGFTRYKTGKLALQDHGSKVWFRNIKIKEL